MPTTWDATWMILCALLRSHWWWRKASKKNYWGHNLHALKCISTIHLIVGTASWVPLLATQSKTASLLLRSIQSLSTIIIANNSSKTSLWTKKRLYNYLEYSPPNNNLYWFKFQTLISSQWKSQRSSEDHLWVKLSTRTVKKNMLATESLSLDLLESLSRTLRETRILMKLLSKIWSKWHYKTKKLLRIRLICSRT